MIVGNAPRTVSKKKLNEILPHFKRRYSFKQLRSGYGFAGREAICFAEEKLFGAAERLNACTEFAKAKLETFLAMQTIFDKMEADWKERITEMKAAFLESVELFLANMKLDARPSSYSSPNNEKKKFIYSQKTSWERVTQSISCIILISNVN
ncbi:hypothetical protein CEXT_200421 [Caerostris extrusa]|uniref:Uncharacterized protein n=1 Tax=Caerostris extrusa TaxID=172846 RepID=A0AAV4SJJ0_CAEEX|nr:hypothetical protein CEXT_200421 [Caerostris extrusa]